MSAITVELSRSYRQAIKALKNQKLRTGAERLANWLLVAAEAQGADSVMIDIEKRVLASYLGMTPENLSRAFATLGPHGVAPHGARIQLTDRTALQRFAGPDAMIDGIE